MTKKIVYSFSPGGYNCMCNVGFELFNEDGTSEYYVPGSETGLRDGDTYRVNKTCVRKMCPALEAPEHGKILTDVKQYRFGDMVRFMCDFGYVLEGNPALLCTSAGQWNGTVPQCNCKFLSLVLIFIQTFHLVV